MEAKPMLSLTATPQLATHCYFAAHQRKASVLWSRDDFRALCHRMLNGNAENDFLLCYRDAQGNAKFSKAFKAKASARIDWAFDTICGTAKSKTGIGFYPGNGDDESCWGALDFDAHDEGERSRACILAGKAFALLSGNPNLWVIAGTSGLSSGWHVFIFTAHFYTTGDWARLLREVADKIGAQIQKGLCEIFPGNNRGLPYGIRAPGSWNPKDDSCGLIAADFATQNLKLLTLPKEKNTALCTRSTPWEGISSLPSRASLPNRTVYRGEYGQWATAFAITAARTRHDKLMKLVGTAFFQVSKEVAQKNAELQWVEAAPAPATPLPEHLVEFDEAWSNFERQWRVKLSPVERNKFDGLTTDNEREAFRILRNWSQTGSPDFKAHCRSLSERLGITLQGASNIRRRLCSLGILRPTAQYVPHKLAARYQWTANNESKQKQATLISPRNGTAISVMNANEKDPTATPPAPPHPSFQGVRV